MSIGISLVLMAVGAMLTWAVTDTSAGINVAAVGVILMVVGLIALGMTLAFWSSFSPYAQSAPFRRNYRTGTHLDEHVVIERPVRPTPRVVIREEPATVIREVAPTEQTVVRSTDDGLG